jgi:hypothetical protein
MKLKSVMKKEVSFNCVRNENKGIEVTLFWDIAPAVCCRLIFLFRSFSTLKMEEISSSETSV